MLMFVRAHVTPTAILAIQVRYVYDRKGGKIPFCITWCVAARTKPGPMHDLLNSSSLASQVFKGRFNVLVVEIY